MIWRADRLRACGRCGIAVGYARRSARRHSGRDAGGRAGRICARWALDALAMCLRLCTGRPTAALSGYRASSGRIRTGVSPACQGCRRVACYTIGVRSRAKGVR